MKNIFYFCIVCFVFSACSSGEITDLNDNIKDPKEVSGESLFAGAQKRLVDQVVTLNVNDNNTKLYAQYITETTYTDEANYDLIQRSIPNNHWRTLYRDVLIDLDIAADNITAKTYVSPEDTYTDNKLAVIEVLSVYTWSNLVETFGDVPYSEALDIEKLNPSYDDGLTIYKDLISRLNAAIGKMDPGVPSFGSSDGIYGGNVASWIKFANSLKLRMGLILKGVSSEASLAEATINEAFPGVFTSNADNANYHYEGSTPNTNPVHVDIVLSGRKDFVASASFAELLNGLDDPRITKFYKELGDAGEVLGGIAGASNNYNDFSLLNDNVSEATANGTIMSYSEVQFLLAEAAAMNLINSNTEDHFNEGVRASLMEWGVDDQAVREAYITSLNFEEVNWKPCISTQSWIALFNRGMEAWTMIRKFDVELPEPAAAVSGFPMRYTYPVTEQTLNGDSWSAAAAAIGTDVVETKLFWDN